VIVTISGPVKNSIKWFNNSLISESESFKPWVDDNSRIYLGIGPTESCYRELKNGAVKTPDELMRFRGSVFGMIRIYGNFSTTSRYARSMIF